MTSSTPPSRAWTTLNNNAMLVPFRYRTFRRVFVAQVTSRTGDVVFLVGLAAYAVEHRDAALLAYPLLTQSIGAIAMLLIGGVLVDRVGARRVLIASDTGRFVAVLAAAVIVGADVTQSLPLTACGLLLGIGDGAFEPAFTVAFAEMLPGDALLAANSVQSVALRLSYVVGAALGGGLVAVVGSAGALTFDAVTFAVSVGCVLAAGRWPSTPMAPEPLLRSAVAGLRFVASQRWIWISIASFGLSIGAAIAPSKVLIPLLLQDLWPTDSSAYGLLLAAQGAGALVGGILAGRRRTVARPCVFIFVMMVCMDASFGLIAVSRSMVLSLAASAAVGAALAAATVVWAASLQRRVPATLLGRVSSVDWLVSLGAAPLSLAAVPNLLPQTNAAILLLIGGGIGVLSSLVPLLARDVRTFSWRDAVVGPGPEAGSKVVASP